MALSIICCIVCMTVGTPIGEVSSLVSINVVLAALLGRIFLGEPLRWVHFFSAALSLTGALLIARPRVLFGAPGGETAVADSAADLAWIGYVLAPIAGLLDACTLISVRKCPGASEWHIAFSFYSQSCLLLVALAFVKQESPSKLEATPGEAAAWMALLGGIDLPGMLLFTLAAMCLPAAMSATMDTTGRIVLGFLADVLFFHRPLELLPGTGALLMLIGVGSMALVRERSPAAGAAADVEQPSKAKAAEVAGDAEQQTVDSETGETAVDAEQAAEAEAEAQVNEPRGEEQADILSDVASFAAAEFIDVEPRSRLLRLRAAAHQLRLRSQQRLSKPAASAVGVVAAAASSQQIGGATLASA